MRVSIWTTLQQPWAGVEEVVAHAEATGWDGAYVADHFMGDGARFGAVDTPTLEATAALAALAATTSRLRLGSLVLGATYRHPAVLAKWAATVDHVSGGRLVLGVGAGWQRNEHEQYGIELPPPGDRLRRLDESCRIIKGLLAEERTSVSGRHFRVTDAVAEPKPLQRPLPLLVGGKGDRMLRLVARHADEWNLWGTAPTIAARAAELERACAEEGRDPRTIARSAQALVLLTDDASRASRFVTDGGDRAVAGSVAQVADAFAAWQAAELDEVIVPDFALGSGRRRLDAMDTIIEQVAPDFR